jgi:hypothetical protein
MVTINKEENKLFPGLGLIKNIMDKRNMILFQKM